MAWIATSLLRYRGRIYRKGAAVPADDPHQRRSFERLGRIRWVDDPAPEPEAEPTETVTDPEPVDLDTMTRAELNDFAADHGIDDPASYPNKAALIEAIAAALASDELDEGNTA